MKFRPGDITDIAKDDANYKPEKSRTAVASIKPPKSSAVHSCWFCAKPGRSLLKCSVCRKARYCGETCQWEDWGRHRKICKSREKRREGKRKRIVDSDEVD